MDAVTTVPAPVNEPAKTYASGSPERAALEKRIKELTGQEHELTMTIGGEQRMGGGERVDVVQPHNHRRVLGRMGNATEEDTRAAIEAAMEAAPVWRAMPFDDRAAVFLKAADLLAGPMRPTINAATMLGQSKSPYQAEIEAACELIDFWRFNVYYGRQILAEQPRSEPGVWNRMEYRPLEGFVLAVTPFNFTAIAGNLPTAPALMGGVSLWKPSPTQQLAAHYTMRALEEAGLPPGVVNMVTGDGQAVSRTALADPRLAGVHFTGSTGTFRYLWQGVAENLPIYHDYPRIVGESGGKDFVFAHPTADPEVLSTALIRGAFEYQGQKCSAASRAYIPRSVWSAMRDEFVDEVESLTMGDVTSDLSLFMGAVIDDKSFGRLSSAMNRLREAPSIRVLSGGGVDDREGYFVEPTVVEGADPTHEVFTEEYFGPILGVFVYDDGEYDQMLEHASSVAKYGLTGSIIARDRAAIGRAQDAFRYAAGNLYINDKPTGSIVGQQPFGGARASGTNDKAGSPFNLQRWVSPRVVKETFVPPRDYRYPSMG